jgi:uncharacterized coiled-coil protein SlyX
MARKERFEDQKLESEFENQNQQIEDLQKQLAEALEKIKKLEESV